MLLSLNNVETAFGDRTLFSNVSFEVREREKIGFIGVNGCGKTTLFRLIKGELAADAGEIITASGCRVGFMEQFAYKSEQKTLFDEALTVFSELSDMELEIEELVDKMNYGDHSAEIIEKCSALREKFESEGGLTYKSRTSSALAGLGFSEDDLRLSTSALSGGQLSKLQLAKLLLSGADLLLLDEPTNHLDINSVEWLESFLLDYKGAYIVISHDRYFLDKVTERTLELENERLSDYKGNYSAHLKQRETRRLTEQRNYDYTMREIHRLEEVVEQQRRWKHKKNQKTHIVDSKIKAIERLEKTLEKPEEEPDAIKFRFRSDDGCGNDVLEARKLKLSFDGKEIFRNVDIEIKKGERVFLIGANGCGKTSLFRILTGEYKQDEGELKFGVRVKTGYFDQAQRGLHAEKTAMSEIHDEYPQMTETAVRTALAAFLFKGDDVFKRISELSGGERARVALLKLMLSGANLLLLDEPTNHLDINSREALENALAGYDGTLFVISHDRYLVNKLADRIYRLNEKGAENYPGNYDYFLEKQGKIQNFAAEAKVKKVSENAQDYREKKERESEKRRLLTRISRLEAEIERLDGEIKSRSEELAALTDYQRAMELSNEISALQSAQEAAMSDWEDAQTALERDHD